MATASLLEFTAFKWKQAFPLPLSHRHAAPNNPFSIPCKPIYCHSLTLKAHNFSNFSVNPSLVMYEHLITSPSNLTQSQKFNPFEHIHNTIAKALKALQKPAITVVMVGILLIISPDFAIAASGGRMGGRSSSSSSGSSKSYRVSNNTSSPSEFGITMEIFCVILLLFIMGSLLTSVGSNAAMKTSVLKHQVGLVQGRALQEDLNGIAEAADTSSPKGLSFVLTETSSALLRHTDCCISAYSYVDVKFSMEDGEKCFNQLLIEERAKLDEETLVNVDGIKKQSTRSTQKASGLNREYMVITILVAAEGMHQLPTINGSGDLKKALQKLCSISTSKITEVQVLWTPQNEDDVLTEQELLEKYPLLKLSENTGQC